MPFIGVLKAYDQIPSLWARYASMIILELWEVEVEDNSSQVYVRVVFNNQVIQVGDCKRYK